MKNLIKSICFLSLVLSLVVIQSCKKPKPCPKEDPCKNTELVQALDATEYSFAHLMLVASSNNASMLYVNNWSDYASKIIPGENYRIAYQEIQCKPYGWCGTNIREGGCFPQRKCVNIICLQAVKQDCLGTILNSKDNENISSCAIRKVSVNGQSVKILTGFSGCSINDYSALRLKMRLLPLASATGAAIWEAKVINTNEINCQAYFEKEVCFDLKDLSNYYLLSNIAPMPKSITIRLFTNALNTYEEFEYVL